MFELSVITVAIGLAVAVLIYRYLTRNYFYFADKPIPFMKPTLGWGNFGPLLMKKRDFFEHFKLMYNSFPDARIFGAFRMADPVYMVRDPAMIKRIAVKDFDHFVDHTGMSEDASELENSHMMAMNTLVALRGQKWRDMRATLSPAFTGSKMRQMFTLIAECGLGMVEFYKGKIASEGGAPQVVEVKEMFSRFTNDVIASTAFGIKVDSFKDKNNEIFALGNAIMQQKGFVQALKMLGYTVAPRLMLKMNIDFMSKEHDRFFRAAILDTMKIRQEKNIFRPDMIELLIQARKGSLKHGEESQSAGEGFAVVEESQVGKSSHNRVWSDSELIAQALVFFLAGFETVASTLSFATYELTRNVEVQSKLYQEILDTEQSLDGKPLTYEKLQAMQYLDMVVSETLRLWPVGTLLDRLCVKDYMYDDGQGCRFKIEKGKTVMASIVGMHHDAKYYPEPEKFDPERFSEENRRNINPDTYLPFGVGPRSCIGSRFALMEVKAIIYYMLLNFSFEVHEKTQIPLKLLKSPSRLATEQGIWIELRPRVSKA